MKAEQRKKLEKNLLAEKLSTAWAGMSSNSAKANRLSTILLVVFVLVLGWVLYSRYTGGSNSVLWQELEFANNLDQLKKIIANDPKTTQGQLARIHLSRVQMLESLAKLDAPNPDERVKAADTLATVKATYMDVAKDSKLPAPLIQEAMLQNARAEEALATVPKDSDPAVTRGTLDAAKRLYEEVAAKFPGSYAGKEAAARVEHIKAKKAEIEKLYAELAKEQAKAPPAPVIPTPTPPAPTLPGLDPPVVPAPAPTPPANPTPDPPKQ